MFFKRSDRHFRGKKTKVKGTVKTHPNYVVGEDHSNYYSLGLTHSACKGKKHKNHKLVRNPKQGETSTAYIHKKIETADKRLFSKKYGNYQMSKEDDDYIDTLIEKKRNHK